MAAGDITASTPVFSLTEAALDTALSALNLALATDQIFVIPHNGGFLSWKTERAAA